MIDQLRYGLSLVAKAPLYAVQHVVPPPAVWVAWQLGVRHPSAVRPAATEAVIHYYTSPELPPIPKLADNECPECEGIPCKCDD
jgi:hypothetical protein